MFNHLGRVIVSMRKDLGLRNKGFKKDSKRLFRALFKDYHSSELH